MVKVPSETTADRRQLPREREEFLAERHQSWKLGRGSKRQKRVGIVALAQRLAVAIWRYLEYGVVPEGAHLKGVAA